LFIYKKCVCALQNKKKIFFLKKWIMNNNINPCEQIYMKDHARMVWSGLTSTVTLQTTWS
jgi:hypothetical protein